MTITCPSCQTVVTKVPVNWKCPHCSERLPDPTKWELFVEGLVAYLQEKGMIFWSLTLLVLLLATGGAEMVLGEGYLLSYIGGNFLFSLLMIFFGGMLIDMIAKINLPLRLLTGTDFIFKERITIRNVRKATNVAALLGLITAVILVGPTGFFLYFPAYIVIIAWWLAMGWSIVGLFMDPRLMEDTRLRIFMERLGVLSFKQYRKMATPMIGGLTIIAVAFIILLNTHKLIAKIVSFGPLGESIKFAKAYFGWLF